jgi:hypothetical protein
MLSIFSIAFFLIGVGLAYAVVVRPLLHSQPSLAAYYARVDSFWAAVSAKLSGIRTKLLAGLLMLASFLVGMHDFLLPIAMGVDWSPLTDELPPWAWPIMSFALGALFYWLRQLTPKTQDRQMAAVEAGAPPAVATVIADTTSTPAEAVAAATDITV